MDLLALVNTVAGMLSGGSGFLESCRLRNEVLRELSDLGLIWKLLLEIHIQPLYLFADGRK